MSIYNILILLLMTLMGALGGYFFKQATTSSFGIVGILGAKWLYLGVCAYFIGAALNIYLLNFIPYSVIMPMNAITYIWTLIIANKFLGEKITSNKIIGMVGIVAGIMLISI